MTVSRGEPQVPDKSTENSRTSGSSLRLSRGHAQGRAPVAPLDAEKARARASAFDLLLVALLLGTGVAAGWLAGRGSTDEMVLVDASFSDQNLPGIGAAQPDSRPNGKKTSDTGSGRDAAQIGQLKAEMLRLRVLFQRLAEVAEIEHEGEFDLNFEIDAKTGDGEPLSQLDPQAPDALPVLFARLDPMINQVNSLQSMYLDRRRSFDRRLSGSPLAEGSMSSGFGSRVDPVTGQSAMHHGLDFVADVGEPVLAIADGVVTWSGSNGGYGLLVELEHAGDFSTRYAHNDATLVEAGDRVRKGEIIATLGSSGRSTGPHLHLEVRHRGTATDPRYFIR